MIQHTFIEHADRVLRITLRHSKRRNRGRFYVSVESGRPFSKDEAERIMRTVVADMIAAGADVTRWGAR